MALSNESLFTIIIFILILLFMIRVFWLVETGGKQKYGKSDFFSRFMANEVSESLSKETYDWEVKDGYIVHKRRGWKLKLKNGYVVNNYSNDFLSPVFSRKELKLINKSLDILKVHLFFDTPSELFKTMSNGMPIFPEERKSKG